PCRSSRRTSLPSLGGTALFLRTREFAPVVGRTLPPQARGFHYPVTPRSGSVAEAAGPPRFLGNPIVHMPCSPTPAGPPRQAHLGASVLPSVISTTSAPTTRTFRGSITRPTHSLSTLRQH